MQTPEFRRCEPAKTSIKNRLTRKYAQYYNLYSNEVFCDIKLETDDKKIILAHKVVLASGSPYFHAMFTHFAESNHDHVVMSQLNSTALKLLVNFIYSGEIVVTEKNILVLLPAANLLQLQEVKEACGDFLQSLLCPTNCIGINAIADLHSCTKLLTSSELYIQQHFSEVVGGEEFLSLSSEQVIKLISSDEISVPSEEKVFESVILWVKHELGSRKCILPQLMEHVRLPLTSNEYIFKKVVEEPLIKNCLKCNNYIIEALHFHLLKSEEPIPQNIRIKPRHGQKIILVVSGLNYESCKSIQWYDPKMNRWHCEPKIITYRNRPGIAIMNDNLVFAVGGYDKEYLESVEVLDLSLKTPFWKPSVDMLTKRDFLGVGVINNYLFAIGGKNKIDCCLNSAEVFDYNTQEWSMISSMSTKRVDFGVGVLDNLLYAVGGYNTPPGNCLDTVECYNSSLDTWTSVAKMCVRRKGVRVGALDGVLYAVGGSNILSSVEAYRPSTGVWTPIADMHSPRRHAGVVVLHGVLYVIGGHNGTSSLVSVECYCPYTNEWSIVTASRNIYMEYIWIIGGVVAINRTHHFNTC